MANMPRLQSLLLATVMVTGVLFSPVAAQAHAAVSPKASWHAASATVTPVGEAVSISCARNDVCEAVTLAGQVALVPSSAPDAMTIDQAGNTPDSISCPTLNFCVAVDIAGNIITELNGTWGAPVPSVQQKPSPIIWSGVSCSSDTQCLAVGVNSQFYPEYAYLQGSTWHVGETTETLTEFNEVSCQGNTCLATNSNGESVTFTLSTTAPPAVGSPKGIDATQQGFVATSISCASPTYCVAAGKDGILVPWSNGSWGAGGQVFPAATTNGSIVSCALLGCVAFNQAGSYAAQVTPGGSWSTPTTSSVGDQRPEALSCTDTTTQTPSLSCTGVDLFGFTYDITIDPSNVPVVSALPTMFAPADALRTVTCLHPNDCLLGTTGGSVATWNGKTLALSPQVTDEDFGAQEISCSAHTSPAATTCMMMTTRGDVYLQTGLTGEWVLQAADAGAVAVSCTVGCEVLLSSGPLVGATPGVMSNFPEGTKAGLHCVTSTSTCVVVAMSGQFWRENGGQWSVGPSVPVSNGAYVTAVSCLSATNCVAGTSTGRLDTLAGATWHQSAIVTDQRVQTLSCTATYFCMATDTAGNAWVFNGVNWKRSFAPLLPSDELLSVSCSTTSSCVAATIFGAEEFTLSQLSSSVAAHVVGPATTARTVVSALVTSTGAPTGAVSFSLGGATCVATLRAAAKGEEATCTIAHASKGGQTLVATFAGGYGYLPAHGSSHVTIH